MTTGVNTLNKPPRKRSARRKRTPPIEIAWRIRDILSKPDHPPVAEVARTLDIGRETAFRYWREIQDGKWDDRLANYDRDLIKGRREITEETKQAFLVDDPEHFMAFCAAAWPEQQPPPHIRSFADAAFDYEKRKWKTRVVINVPVNHAKSTYFNVRWCIWRICQNRDWRMLVVSETSDLAKFFVGEVAAELEGNEFLIENFGGDFRDEGDPTCRWLPASGALRVLGSHVMRGYNVFARGWGTQIQSLRADEIILDDIITDEDCLTPSQREDTERKLQRIVLRRLDPGGICRAIATRQHPLDIYGKLAGMQWEGQAVWEHIQFAALFDPQTGEPSMDPETCVALWECETHKPVYPDCCRAKDYLLGPEVLGGMTPADFQLTYQQQPMSEDMMVFLPEWIYGTGDEPDRGCLDRTRVVGPQQQEKNFIRVVSVDSSEVNYWGVIVADVEKAENFYCRILEIQNEKFTTQKFLDSLEIIFEKYKPQFLIPEVNMKRDFWKHDPQLRDLMQRYNVRMKDHLTNINKQDSTLGVAAMALAFATGNVRIPYGDIESRSSRGCKSLVDELLSWTHDKSHGRDDVVMAMWFIYYQYRSIVRSVPRHTGFFRKNSGWAVPARLSGGW